MPMVQPSRAQEPSPRRSRSPGPAHYTEPAWRFMHVDKAQVGPSTGSTFQSYPYSSAAFSSKVKKHQIINATGDPAAYNIDGEDLAPNSKASFRVPNAKARGSFNSTSDARPRSAPPRSTPRGPGQYDYQHMYATGRDYSSSQKIVSSFRSAVPQGGHVRKATTPRHVGVGCYDVHGNPDHVQAKCLQRSRHCFSRDGSSMFAGNSPSSRTPLADQMASRTDKSVGPGSYDLSPGSIRHTARMRAEANKRRPGFASSSPRASFTDYLA